MFAFQQALRAIRNNWIASVSTITTMTLSLMLLAAFSLLSLNIGLLLQTMQGELELAAYLAPAADGEAVVRQIESWAEVQQSSYTSPEQALAELQAEFDYIGAVSSQVENPLPATIRIQLIDPSQTALISQRLRALPAVADVEDGSDAVATFIAVNKALQVVGVVLITILLIAALFAIVNAIRVAITARKDEIEVMRLVGAAPRFIRAPFLVEGVIFGVISALIAIALTVPTYAFIVNQLADQLVIIPFMSSPATITQVMVLLVILAILVGLVGSTISVAQYLRERY